MDSANNKKKHDFKVKAKSCLNELRYYNGVNGLAPDMMHDILEGVVRIDFKK